MTMMFNTYNNVPTSKAGKDGRRNSDAALIGMPFDLGSSGLRRGQCLAPEMIREAGGWPDGMRSSAHDVDPQDVLCVVDTGDIDLLEVRDAEAAWVQFQHHYLNVMKNTRLPLVLGGDQSVTGKAVEAWAQAHGDQLTVFHFDSHGDYDKAPNNLDHNSWVRYVIDGGHVSRVVQFGIRGWGIDRVESNWASKNDVYTYLASTPKFQQRLYEELHDTPGPIYLTIDISVLDPAFAPGVGYPEPGGITSRELFSMIHQVMITGRVVGADIMEVAPPYDSSGVTVKLAHRCVAAILTGVACAP